MVRVRPAATFVIALSFPVIAAAQPQLPPPALAHRPDILTPQHHDVTPALRDMRLIAPEQEKEETPHAPLPVHGGPRRLSERRDGALQAAPGSLSAITPRVSFGGIGNISGVLPPDTNGDVGPDHYVQWVNLAFAVFRKSDGAILYGPADGKTLWQGFGDPCMSSNDGDPIVLYDEIAGRWLMSQFALPNYPRGPYYQCIAISTTGDPLGSWNRYSYSFSKMNDYPKFGVWPDGYYMTMNQFTSCTRFGCAWGGQGVVAFERAQMLSGGPARAVYFDMAAETSLGGMLPADLDGPTLPPGGAPAYFMQFDDQPDQLQLWQFHADWTTLQNSSFTRKALLPTSAFDSNMCGGSRNCIPQPGTNPKLDALADRLMYRLQYRNFGTYETLVTNHTVDVGADRGAVRWYEVRNPGTAPVIYQQGTYGPADTLNRWIGSAAMDSAGNLAIGYSVSSTTTYPSIRFSGRLAGDPLGTLTVAESDLQAGTGSQGHSSGRWGDYSMLAVDPSDGCTFWFTSEYYLGSSSAGWKTGIGSFRLNGCGGPPPPPPPAAPSALGASATSSSNINLVWTDNSSDETGFAIERCLGAGCSNFAPLTTTAANATSYSDGGLAASTTYTYRVKAVNAPLNLSSGYSNTTAATTSSDQPPPPAAPSGLGASATSSSAINLAWTDNSGDETGFAIERCLGAGCSNFAPVTTTAANATTYSDSGLAASTTYTYRVKAVNAPLNLSSGYSNTAAATTQTDQQPPPGDTMHVSNLAGTQATNGKMGWKASVTITLANSGGAAVANATVTASWSDGYTGTDSCVTNSLGSCTVATGRIANTVPSVLLTVTNATHATLTYKPADNVISSVTVIKP